MGQMMMAMPGGGMGPMMMPMPMGGNFILIPLFKPIYYFKSFSNTVEFLLPFMYKMDSSFWFNTFTIKLSINILLNPHFVFLYDLYENLLYYMYSNEIKV